MIRNNYLTLSSFLFIPEIHAQELSAYLINDFSKLVSGGITETYANRTLASVSVDFTMGDHYLIHADVALLRGDNGTIDTGAIQAYSNIDDNEFSKIFEVWLEGNYQDYGIRFKLGQIDANSEFAYIGHSDHFIHSSMGFSPSITFMPTYPAPTLAATFFWQPNDHGTASFAIFSDDSNQFNESFYIGEWTQIIKSMTVKIGYWHQTGKVEAYSDAEFIDGTQGLYAAAQGSLNAQLLSSRSAGWFSQLGYSDDNTAEIDFHFGAGIAFYNTFNREGDVAGLGLTHVKTSRYLHNELQSSETAFEIFYRYQLNDYLVFKPDIQYIVDPATEIHASNALVLTLRTELSF